MSLARTRAGRGTWKLLATLAVALVIPATGFARVTDTPDRSMGRHEPSQRARTATPKVQARSKKPDRSKAPKNPKNLKNLKNPKQNEKPTVEDLIRDEFGPQADAALAVARCESKFNPTARSHAGARGIFQIMPVHSWRIARVGGTTLDDPKTNIRVARALFQDEGWRPWVCARLVGVR